MFISGGGSGKGNDLPNQQRETSTSSSTTEPHQQQLLESIGTISSQLYSNMQPLMVPPLFHPAYVPHQSTNNLYALHHPFRFSLVQSAGNFLNYQIQLSNPSIQQIRPSASSGFQTVNPTIPLLSNVGNIRSPSVNLPVIPTETYTCGDLVIKKRKHALPIINPLTKKNILDEIEESKLEESTNKNLNEENSNSLSDESASNVTSNVNVKEEAHNGVFEIHKSIEEIKNSDKEIVDKIRIHNSEFNKKNRRVKNHKTTLEKIIDEEDQKEQKHGNIF